MHLDETALRAGEESDRKAGHSSLRANAGEAESLGLGSSLDKLNDDWDKTVPVSQILLSITSHENYNYRQIWSRSACHGRTLWSWSSG